jgi:hypothetical protein
LKINRAATAWLIRCFIDPDAHFCSLRQAMLPRKPHIVAAPGFTRHERSTRLETRRDERRFEMLVDEHCSEDRALRLMAVIVKDADMPNTGEMPEAPGLRLISGPFPLLTSDDSEIIARSAFMYDALYAALQRRLQP